MKNSFSPKRGTSASLSEVFEGVVLFLDCMSLLCYVSLRRQMMSGNVRLLLGSSDGEYINTAVRQRGWCREGGMKKSPAPCVVVCSLCGVCCCVPVY